MKTLTGFLLILALFVVSACSATQENATINKNSRMEFIVTKIQNEMDGQTLFLKDDNGNKFTTIISIPNGNFVEVKKGDRISLIVKDTIKIKPIAIVSKDIKVLNPIETKIVTDKKTYEIGEPIILSMEVKNTGKKPYTFLPWKTPIENRFTGECLNITYNNKVVEYIGIMVKRMPPTKKDFITLKTGEIATGKVNVLDGYQLTEKGIYIIEFKEEHKGLPKSNSIKIEIK